MKNCNFFQRRLTAYLHGELSDRDFQTLEVHLATCATCRAELAAQRATLELLAATLESAPAPERLVVWKPSRKTVRRPQNAFARFWFSPWLRGVLGTGALAAFFFLLAGMFVVFTVVKKREVSFTPPVPVEQPKMKLKKPKVRMDKSAKPKPTTRIVTKVNRASMPDIQLPEISGTGKELAASKELEAVAEPALADAYGGAGELARTHNGSFASKKVPNLGIEAQETRVAGIGTGQGLGVPPASEPVPAVPMAREEAAKRWCDAWSMERFVGDGRTAQSAVFNPYVLAAENAFSSFPINVDTASYSLARDALLMRKLPEAGSVRTEEFINSFDYGYPPPMGNQTFAVHAEMAPSPFLLDTGVPGSTRFPEEGIHEVRESKSILGGNGIYPQRASRYLPEWYLQENSSPRRHLPKWNLLKIGIASRLRRDDPSAALQDVVASDVQIRIEFNPERVVRYRLIGYENRPPVTEEVCTGSVDAGSVGAGQSVTALYDVELDPDGSADEPIATIHVHYRRADNGEIEKIGSRVMETVCEARFEDADSRFRLAACVAAFAEHLRRSPHVEGAGMPEIVKRLRIVAQEVVDDKQVQELLLVVLIADQLERYE